MKKTLTLSIVTVILSFIGIIFALTAQLLNAENATAKEVLGYIFLFLFVLPILIIQIINILLQKKYNNFQTISLISTTILLVIGVCINQGISTTEMKIFSSDSQKLIVISFIHYIFLLSTIITINSAIILSKFKGLTYKKQEENQD